MSLSNQFLSNLKEQYHQYLFDDFLPFMDNHIVDKKFGGFLCHTDRKGYNISTHKRTWYDGRGIWIYSFLYEHFNHDERYLKVAKKTIDLVLKIQPENNNFWPDTYTKEGCALSNKSGDIYGGLFVAEGLIAFARASGEDSYLAKAKEIFFSAVNKYDEKDYQYAPHYDSEKMGIEAPRILGHWMVFLNISRQILEQDADPKVKEISDRCIDALLKHHLQSDTYLMIEYLHHDFSVPAGKYQQFSYIGHAIEVLWMLMEEADRREDQTLFNQAAKLFKRHVEVAWDNVYGGVFHCIYNIDKNDWLLDKVLWAQEEVMNGLMILIEKNNDEWAQRWLSHLWEYLHNTFILQDNTFRLWINGGDRKLIKHHQINRFENYHHPRHLMLNIMRLRHIL